MTNSTPSIKERFKTQRMLATVPPLEGKLVSSDTLALFKSMEYAAELEVGKTFRNYEELCLALDEPVLTSHSKTAQVKRWQTQFSFTRSGHSYTITDINLSILLPDPPHSCRIDWLTPSFLSLLSYLQSEEIRIAKVQSDHKEFALAHPDVEGKLSIENNPSPPIICYIPITRLHKVLGFPAKQPVLDTLPSEFRTEGFGFLSSLFSTTAHNVLNALSKHAYIHWEPCLLGTDREDKDTRSTFAEYTLYVEATRKALDEVKCTTVWQVYQRNAFLTFHKHRTALTCEALGWKTFKECYALGYTEYTLKSWLNAEYKRMGKGKTVVEWVNENVQTRVARWLREFVEECERLGVLKGSLRELLED